MTDRADYKRVDFGRGYFAQGERKTFVIKVKDPATGLPVNLGGKTLLWMWFDRQGHRLLAVSGSPVNADATLDGAQMTITDTLTISAAGKVLVPDGDHRHELFSAAEDERLAYGQMFVMPSARRQETAP